MKARQSKQSLKCITFQTPTHRFREVVRWLVSEFTQAGYQLEQGVFILPCIRLIYTPQCRAVARAERARAPDDFDDGAAAELEEQLEQAGTLTGNEGRE